jgi:peroxiredoxin
MFNIKGRQPVPSLEVSTVGGGKWSLATATPKTFTLIVFYRGLHCPVCKRYLGELEAMLPELDEAGVTTIAISADTAERAAQSKAEWDLDKLTVGYGLPTAKAREWGLFISHAIRDGEAPEFNEPGLFLVKPDGTLFACCVGNASWTRPPLASVLNGLKFAIERGNPARGEV